MAPAEMRDLRIIVGRGLRSPTPLQSAVRDSALRFLQVDAAAFLSALPNIVDLWASAEPPRQ